MLKMRSFFTSLYALLCFSTCLYAQYQTIVSDDFSDTLHYSDLTKKFLWGSYTQPTSGFRRLMKTDGAGLGFMALNQTDSAQKYAGYIPTNSVKASIAIDYRFPTFNRSNDSLTVEFDVLWDNLVSGGNPGRIVVALMHDLPANIPFNAITDSLNAEAPFGRPAYSFRILNRIPQGTNNYANMMYGGGRDQEGEFEKFSGATGSWWLPGFISGPGGIAPESNAPEYPLGPVKRWGPFTLASATRWRHVTWKIFPEKLEVWVRSSSQSWGNDTLALMMVTPKPGPLPTMLATMQQGHGLANPPDSLPTLYNWFEEVNGVRLFMNGVNPTYFANLSIKGSYVPTSTETEARLTAREVRLFPNPANAIIKAVWPADAESFYITNSNGKVLASGICEGNSMQWQTNSWPLGVYALMVKTKVGVQVKKFVIQ
jgi:hypothetical protein